MRSFFNRLAREGLNGHHERLLRKARKTGRFVSITLRHGSFDAAAALVGLHDAGKLLMADPYMLELFALVQTGSWPQSSVTVWFRPAKTMQINPFLKDVDAAILRMELAA